jgi:hypothetical protein
MGVGVLKFEVLKLLTAEGAKGRRGCNRGWIRILGFSELAGLISVMMFVMDFHKQEAPTEPVT